MKLFIVRHGSTDQLENNQRQTDKSVLSKNGILQISRIAKRLTKIRIDRCYCSTLLRAKQSAEIICNTIKIKPLFDRKLIEINNLSQLAGKSVNSSLAIKYDVDKIKRNFDLDWKFLGRGESVREVVERTLLFIEKIKSECGDDNVLIVSHAYTIRCMISGLIMGINNSAGLLKLYSSLNISKASLSILEYDDLINVYKINLLNDTTHLDGLIDIGIK